MGVWTTEGNRYFLNHPSVHDATLVSFTKSGTNVELTLVSEDKSEELRIRFGSVKSMLSMVHEAEIVFEISCCHLEAWDSGRVRGSQDHELQLLLGYTESPGDYVYLVQCSTRGWIHLIAGPESMQEVAVTTSNLGS